MKPKSLYQVSVVIIAAEIRKPLVMDSVKKNAAAVDITKRASVLRQLMNMKEEK